MLIKLLCILLLLLIFQVLPHEIAVVKLQMVSEMLREMGDWVYDDGDMDDDNNAREGRSRARRHHCIRRLNL